METTRITEAIGRIEAALARIAAAPAPHRAGGDAQSGAQAESGRVIELVNAHEKLREEVADSLRDLDALIAQLEG
ncbi:MAG: hypothetical protein ACXIT4_07440 [Erythrobacter sp.]